MAITSKRFTVDYPWVSVRGLKEDVEAARQLIAEYVGEERCSADDVMREVDDAAGVWELEYKRFIYPVGMRMLNQLVIQLPNLDFRAVSPKPWKYTEEHYEVYSRAGSSECTETYFRSDYEGKAFPRYDWWGAANYADLPPASDDPLASSDFLCKRGKGGLTVTGYRGFETRIGIPAYIGEEPVVAIGRRAFDESHSFTPLRSRVESASIPRTVREIGDEAFFGCNKLSEVTIEEGSELESIGESAFDGASLRAFTIPRSLAKIGLNAFYRCDLVSMGLEEGNEHFVIEGGALYTSDMTELVRAPDVGDDFEVPGTVEVIREAAFRASTVKRVTVPPSVREIGRGAFNVMPDRDNLEEVSFSEGSKLEVIGDFAFFGSRNMTSIALPDGVATVGACAFHSAPFETFDVPATVKSVGKEAFEDCHSLRAVTFAGSNLETVGKDAFLRCEELRFVSFPASLVTPDSWFGKDCSAPFFAPGIPCTEFKKAQYKACAAQGFVVGMAAGASVPEDIEKGYRRYVKGHAQAILEALDFEEGELRWMLDNDYIAPKYAEDIAKSACKRGYSERAALLDDLKAEHAQKEAKRIASLKSNAGKPKAPTVAELKKIWERYKLEDGTQCISGWLGEEPSVTVPSQIGKPVTITKVAGYAFAPFDGSDRPNKAIRKEALEKVVVSEGITEIGTHAFALCGGLREVELPASIEKLGKETFYRCNLSRLVSRSEARITAHALDNASIDELYVSGPIGKQEATCVVKKVFLNEAMSDANKKSVMSLFKKMPNGKEIEFGNWS